MAYFVEVYCRLAIRLCVGYHANGREKYRTLNIPNVRRDATAEDIAAFVRALEPLLDGRVVRVLLVRRDRVVVAGAEHLPFAVTARSAATWQSHTTGAKPTATFLPKAPEPNPETATPLRGSQRRQRAGAPFRRLRAPPANSNK